MVHPNLPTGTGLHGEAEVRKADGKSGILPEMVRGCGGELMDYILDMFHTVWMEQSATGVERCPTCPYPQER